MIVARFQFATSRILHVPEINMRARLFLTSLNGMVNRTAESNGLLTQKGRFFSRVRR